MSELNSISTKRLRQILDPSHPLCREDIIWVLHYVQKKVASKDPALQDLSKPQLLQSYAGYCQTVMSLLGGTRPVHSGSDEIRACLLDIVNGLGGVILPINPSS
ncbi:hypothetical protein [Paenibacillus lemnae]|uniref:Uncharacterized protein n=1 Tax=Paenibacillus lemnae TaxID=1330551 RepID=A0A848M2A8_PAELE|nr:hypothetical protein [Paenibacillus lemnae]NMO94696.1 hypothetical protein [Paenibacillus lemnae]